MITWLQKLEKFKHRKITRAITILPARIGGDDDQTIAVPQKAILKNDAEPDFSILYKTFIL